MEKVLVVERILERDANENAKRSKCSLFAVHGFGDAYLNGLNHYL